MTGILRKSWSEFVLLLLRRPARFQVAALCYRQNLDRTEILLITSRHTGRWILPKGWPVEGKDAAGTAAVEAWEEAGVRPRHVGEQSLGTYHYGKRLRGGVPVPCETKVFPVEVEALADEWPEKGKRQRQWVTPEEAVLMVEEPTLRELLAGLSLPVRP